ncbi:MAG TPA: hypothetical protein VMT89_14285 [Candidatus Acidoferrales bacterium]|nr:hypothetical protein [Candidatus Acidoferrales bacterium]
MLSQTAKQSTHISTSSAPHIYRAGDESQRKEVGDQSAHLATPQLGGEYVCAMLGA